MSSVTQQILRNDKSYKSGDNYEKHYQTFLEQVHSCLQRHQNLFSKVQTKGNTGVNAKKRFIHLRRKGAIADLDLPVGIK